MDIPDNLTAVMGDDEKENGSSQRKKKKEKEAEDSPKNWRFMLSSVADNERQKFVSFLDGQGVAHSAMNSCDPAATHIVAQKLSRYGVFPPPGQTD